MSDEHVVACFVVFCSLLFWMFIAHLWRPYRPRYCRLWFLFYYYFAKSMFKFIVAFAKIKILFAGVLIFACLFCYFSVKPRVPQPWWGGSTHFLLDHSSIGISFPVFYFQHAIFVLVFPVRIKFYFAGRTGKKTSLLSTPIEALRIWNHCLSFSLSLSRLLRSLTLSLSRSFIFCFSST